MARMTWMGRSLVALAGLALVSCSDGSGGGGAKDGGADRDTGSERDARADVDGGANADALTPCLDSPSQLPRAPDGQLPCELLPPDFQR